MFGSPFMTWRGIPIVPCPKLAVKAETTDILLLRTGEKKQGVIGLFQPGLPGEVSPSLSVRFMGINHKAIASYLISLYLSLIHICTRASLKTSHRSLKPTRAISKTSPHSWNQEDVYKRQALGNTKRLPTDELAKAD